MAKKESIGLFKCCGEGKELTCYYCISCNTIQHRSCIDKKKSAVIIKDHRIFCGKTCEKKAMEENDNEEENALVKQLRELIAELQTELMQKSDL